jgi:hypothetical protein
MRVNRSAVVAAALLAGPLNLMCQSSKTAAAGVWIHEPAGLTVLNDYGFSRLNDSGWVNAYAADLTNGHLTLTSDATAPVSPPSVAQFYYRQGEATLCGSAPATLELDLKAPVTTLYIGTWTKFSAGFSFPGGKPSSEVHFLYGNPQSNAWVTVDLRQDGGVEFIGAGGTDRWSRAGLYTVGAWTQVELLMDYGAKTATLWLNGRAVAFNGVTALTFGFAGGGFSKVQVSPTWGGCNGSVPANDSRLSYDHIHVSGK